MRIEVKYISFIGGKCYLNRIPLKLCLLQLNIVRHNVFHSRLCIWLLEHIMIVRFKLRHKCLFHIRTGSTKCSASRQCLYKVQCTSQHNKISVPCSLFSVDFIMALCILANNIVKCAVSTLLSLLGHISILWKSYFHNLFHSQSESKVWQNLSNVASQQVLSHIGHLGVCFILTMDIG